jgi:hypothetical protein
LPIGGVDEGGLHISMGEFLWTAGFRQQRTPNVTV